MALSSLKIRTTNSEVELALLGQNTVLFRLVRLVAVLDDVASGATSSTSANTRSL